MVKITRYPFSSGGKEKQLEQSLEDTHYLMSACAKIKRIETNAKDTKMKMQIGVPASKTPPLYRTRT